RCGSRSTSPRVSRRRRRGGGRWSGWATSMRCARGCAATTGRSRSARRACVPPAICSRTCATACGSCGRSRGSPLRSSRCWRWATAMCGVVDAVLLRPLPFEHGEQLVMLDGLEVPCRSPDGVSYPRSAPALTDLDSMRAVFSGYAAYAPGSLNLTGAGSPVRVNVTLVTPSFFSTLGVRPALGRPFTPEEGEPGAPPVAILSHGLWLRQFGADPGVLERTIGLNGVQYRVIGVMPRDFAFPAEKELWTPFPVPFTLADFEPCRMYLPSSVIARLAPGVTREQ